MSIKTLSKSSDTIFTGEELHVFPSASYSIDISSLTKSSEDGDGDITKFSEFEDEPLGGVDGPELCEKVMEPRVLSKKFWKLILGHTLIHRESCKS